MKKPDNRRVIFDFHPVDYPLPPHRETVIAPPFPLPGLTVRCKILQGYEESRDLGYLWLRRNREHLKAASRAYRAALREWVADAWRHNVPQPDSRRIDTLAKNYHGYYRHRIEDPETFHNTVPCDIRVVDETDPLNPVVLDESAHGDPGRRAFLDRLRQRAWGTLH